MILVDTSVWIEFFRGIEPYFSKLRILIENSEIVAHEAVFGELLQGCKSNQEMDFVTEYWKSLNKLNNEDSFINGGILSYKNKHISKGVGLIDSVLINQVKSNKIKLWTLDKKILHILDEKEKFKI